MIKSRGGSNLLVVSDSALRQPQIPHQAVRNRCSGVYIYINIYIYIYTALNPTPHTRPSEKDAAEEQVIMSKLEIKQLDAKMFAAQAKKFEGAYMVVTPVVNPALCTMGGTVLLSLWLKGERAREREGARDGDRDNM